MGKKAVKSLFHAIMVFLSFVLALLLCIAALARYISPAHSSMVTILGLFMPLLLIVNAIIALIWLFKWKIWVFVPIVAICCCFGYISSVYHINFKKSTNPKGIKVATYNVRSFNNDYTGYSAGEISKFFKQNNVDIVCMQEYISKGHFDTDSVDSVFSLHWKYKFVPKQVDGSTRVAIFSTHPIVRTCFLDFVKSQNCGEWVDMLIGNDTLRVFNLHLQTSSFNQKINSAKKNDADEAVTTVSYGLMENSRMRVKQAEHVQRLVKQYAGAAVLCGDFNDTPSSYTYQLFNEVMDDGFKSCGHGYGATYRYLGRLLKIDYIFTNSHVKGLDYTIFDEPWSDHRISVMTMQLQR
ncbi:MAG: endonuclease/exonuclease/phosphatase family protein [Muribaculaceae bacterium]|jgi:endonuclease/exonuclease/phosphatase family metal-dependent hydrolase|nr:endonuclease/exonuclease/phosphatase family protein [Muribaculaceae bacterium]